MKVNKRPLKHQVRRTVECYTKLVADTFQIRSQSFKLQAIKPSSSAFWLLAPNSQLDYSSLTIGS